MQPFTDVDVLDLTQSIAGPACTQRLATLGATVVKVEPPTGDPFRGLMDGSIFATFNGDRKRSLAVDLKTAEGRAVVQDLASRADVVVEAFRPGVTERFGLDYETVSADNPSVVYTSVTGYGQDGPYSDRAAYDPVLQAMSGLMSVTGYPDRPPVRVGTSVIDCATGANAAFLTSAALHEAGRTGEGTHVDVSLYDVATSWMAYWVADYTETGEVATRHGTGFSGPQPNDVFLAAGDEPLYVCALNETLFERAVRAVDREDLLEDPRFDTRDGRIDNGDALEAELEATFAEYDRDDLLDLLADAGVPAGPRRDVAELVEDDPHLRARDALVDVYNRFTGETAETIRLPIRTTDWVPDLEGRPPALGEHTRAVLADLGYDDGEIDALFEDEVVVAETAD
jgi:crotonobetainyl-CoA:carnitine CoA-transferase CaiB-like acyl-CoA transferase